MTISMITKQSWLEFTWLSLCLRKWEDFLSMLLFFEFQCITCLNFLLFRFHFFLYHQQDKVAINLQNFRSLEAMHILTSSLDIIINDLLTRSWENSLLFLSAQSIESYYIYTWDFDLHDLLVFMLLLLFTGLFFFNLTLEEFRICKMTP